MSTKRKISIRKILQAIVTVIVTSGCIVAIMGASKMQQTKTLNQIQLHVKNEDKYQFLDKQALWNDLVKHNNIEEHKTKLARLDIKSIEKEACKNYWVSEAQVYVDNRRNMHIYVSQRVPVARIFFENGQSFYLDASLNLLPLSEMFTYYTTIVTNVPVLANDSLNKNLRAQIVKMVKFVERDSFWSVQIAQIGITPDLKFELTPVLGTHKIIFGDTSQMTTKFNNLFSFYKKVLNRIGWDKYEQLDLRFKDQVIASPALPWKPSTKNAISNMDWVKSIMGDAVKDTVKTIVTAHVKMIAKENEIADNISSKKATPQHKQSEKAKNDSPEIHSIEPQAEKYIYQGATKN